MRKVAFLLFALLALYLGSYLLLRSRSIERWSADQHDYLIFPQSPVAVYYIYRPLTYIDGRLTGLRFHIGPHR